MSHILQWTVWYHVWWTDGEHQEADQSNIKGDRQVEADVERAAHIGTAYSHQKPKVVEALHVPLCPSEPNWPFARLLFQRIFQRFMRYAAWYSGLWMPMLKSISFPSHVLGCDTMWSRRRLELKYHPRRRRRNPCALLERPSIFRIEISGRTYFSIVAPICWRKQVVFSVFINLIMLCLFCVVLCLTIMLLPCWRKSWFRGINVERDRAPSIMVQSPNDSDVGRKRNAADVSENF